MTRQTPKARPDPIARRAILILSGFTCGMTAAALLPSQAASATPPIVRAAP